MFVFAVTPLAGVWIEIDYWRFDQKCKPVTPLVGVWIEIVVPMFTALERFSHSPCGSVE